MSGRQLMWGLSNGVLILSLAGGFWLGIIGSIVHRPEILDPADHRARPAARRHGDWRARTRSRYARDHGKRCGGEDVIIPESFANRSLRTRPVWMGFAQKTNATTDATDLRIQMVLFELFLIRVNQCYLW